MSCACASGKMSRNYQVIQSFKKIVSRPTFIEFFSLAANPCIMVAAPFFSFSCTIFIQQYFSLWFCFVLPWKHSFLWLWESVWEQIANKTKKRKNKVQSESREWNTIQAPCRPITLSSMWFGRSSFLICLRISSTCWRSAWHWTPLKSATKCFPWT